MGTLRKEIDNTGSQGESSLVQTLWRIQILPDEIGAQGICKPLAR